MIVLELLPAWRGRGKPMTTPMKTLRICTLVTMLWSAPALFSAEEAPGEFWFAKRTDGQPGTGTLQDPYNARNSETFDGWMRKIPERSVIHLLPGEYETMGFSRGNVPGFVVKNGWRIKGAGTGNTTLKLVAVATDRTVSSGWNAVLFSGWGKPVSHVSIEDLTVDCNYQGISKVSGLTNLSTQAVFLLGDNLRVERVKAIRAAGLRYDQGGKLNPETFVITVGPHGDTEQPWGYRIHDCEVSEFAGGFCTAIAIAGAGSRGGATGVISGNRVRLSEPGQFAYSGYASSGILIENNVAIGAHRGLNWDTGQGRNLVVRGNFFLEQPAIGAMLGGAEDSVFENNIIELTGSNSVGIKMSAKNSVFPGASGWIIRNNVIRNLSKGKNFAVQFVNEVPPPGSVFEYNRVDPSLKFGDLGKGFESWSNNTDLEGRALRKP